MQVIRLSHFSSPTRTSPQAGIGSDGCPNVAMHGNVTRFQHETVTAVMWRSRKRMRSTGGRHTDTEVGVASRGSPAAVWWSQLSRLHIRNGHKAEGFIVAAKFRQSCGYCDCGGAGCRLHLRPTRSGPDLGSVAFLRSAGEGGS